MPETFRPISVYTNMQTDIVIRQASPDGNDSVVVVSADYVPQLILALQAEMAKHNASEER